MRSSNEDRVSEPQRPNGSSHGEKWHRRNCRRWGWGRSQSQWNCPQLIRRKNATKLWKTALSICSAMKPGVRLTFPGANPRLPKDLVPPLQPHSLLRVTDPALSPALVAPWSVRQHLDGLALPGGTAGKPRVVVFHTGYLLPLPAALFWEQFHHLTINILGTGTLSTSLLVISVFL